jgi:alpha-beta hydrolase superfamily lysophospholipase
VKTFETNFRGQDGNNFYAQGWEPNHVPPKALIALIHGLGEHTGRYRHVGEAMTAAGYALVGFDLRGHGRSDGARGHTPSLDVYMQDFRQFFQFVQPRYPGLPGFLYGHSLGGLLTLTYAIQYGSGLKGVLVTSPGLRSALQEQKAKVALVRLLGSLLPTMTARSGLDPRKISRDPAVVQAYLGDPLVHFVTSLGFGKAGLSAIDLCFGRAGEFPVPLLILHGSGDEIAFPSGSEEFAKRVRAAGGEVTLKTWEGLYHELHNEPEKADVFKFMIEWLDRHF